MPTHLPWNQSRQASHPRDHPAVKALSTSPSHTLHLHTPFCATFRTTHISASHPTRVKYFRIRLRSTFSSVHFIGTISGRFSTAHGSGLHLLVLPLSHLPWRTIGEWLKTEYTESRSVIELHVVSILNSNSINLSLWVTILEKVLFHLGK